MIRSKPGAGAVVLALVLVLALGSAAARPYSIRMVVTVTDCTTTQPIQGAMVKALSAATALGSQNQAVTNEAGSAVIDPLLVGGVDHTVEASAAGYIRKTQKQLMQDGSTVEMSICLERNALPPTGTPVPEAMLAPEVTQTALQDQANVCGSYLGDKLKGMAAPDDRAVITDGASEAAKCMLQCRDAAFAPGPGTGVGVIEVAGPAIINYTSFYTCFRGCSDTGYYRNSARVILTNATPSGEMISTLASVLEKPEGIAACGDAGPVVFQLVKQLAIQGAQVNIVAVHSPVNLWVTDKEGKRAGFWQDGTKVIDIPGAKVVSAEESRYVLLPLIPELKIDMKSSGQGTATLELAYTKSDTVQDAAFYDQPVAPEMVGSIDLTPSQPKLTLGTQSSPPSYFEAQPVIPTPTKTAAFTATETPPASNTPEAGTATPTGTATPGGWLNDPRLETAGIATAACCAGVVLVGALLGIVIGIRRSRRGKAQPAASAGRECPRCGANCQVDARFCYKCGFSFVQPAASQDQAMQKPAMAQSHTPPTPAAQPPAYTPPAPAVQPPVMQQPSMPPPPPPIACTKCGQALRPESKFCLKCGQPTGR